MYQLAKFVNFTLKNRRNLILVFSSLSGIIAFLLQSISLFFFLETVVIILGYTTVRVSDVLIYNKILHVFSMSLVRTDLFSCYDYKIQKELIARIFKEEFIKGILNIPSNYAKCETHSWMLKNVFLDNRVTEVFSVQSEKIGSNPHNLEVLLLASGNTCNLHPRECHRVVLRRIKN